MSRRDACTVSWTVIELDTTTLRMNHHQGAPRENTDPIEHTLVLSDRRAAPAEARNE